MTLLRWSRFGKRLAKPVTAPPSDLPINALLLLSYSQQPCPDDEVIQLHELCATKGEVWFAATRNVSAVSEEAEIAFYADSREEFAVLATAKFAGFVPLETAQAESILSSHEIYGSRCPERMRGFIKLREFKLADKGTQVDDLCGWMANGRRLIKASISASAPDPSIYYIKADVGEFDLGVRNQSRLWQAKCDELTDKYNATREDLSFHLSNALTEYQKQLSEVIIERDEAIVERDKVARARDDALAQRDEAVFNQSSRVGGNPKRAARIVRHMMNAVFPGIELEGDSAEVIVLNYNRSDSLFSLLAALRDEGHIRGAIKIKDIPDLWEAKFGDNLGRLYFRQVRRQGKLIIKVLISQRDEQARDLRNHFR